MRSPKFVRRVRDVNFYTHFNFLLRDVSAPRRRTAEDIDLLFFALVRISLPLLCPRVSTCGYFLISQKKVHNIALWKKNSILGNRRISTLPNFDQTKKLTSKSLNKYSTIFRKDEIIQCWDLLLQTRKVYHEN